LERRSDCERKVVHLHQLPGKKEKIVYWIIRPSKSHTLVSQFDSPSSVLNEVVRIHPELTNMVIPILNTLEQSRLRESTKDTEDRNRHLSMCGENVNLNSLNEFLLRYSPLQLLSDRKSARRLAIGRCVLSLLVTTSMSQTLL
jgi:hypothetical protein